MRQSRRGFAREALFLIVALSVSVTSVFASRAGTLDPTFGTGGGRSDAELVCSVGFRDSQTGSGMDWVLGDRVS